MSCGNFQLKFSCFLPFGIYWKNTYEKIAISLPFVSDFSAWTEVDRGNLEGH